MDSIPPRGLTANSAAVPERKDTSLSRLTCSMELCIEGGIGNDMVPLDCRRAHGQTVHSLGTKAKWPMLSLSERRHLERLEEEKQRERDEDEKQERNKKVIKRGDTEEEQRNC